MTRSEEKTAKCLRKRSVSSSPEPPKKSGAFLSFANPCRDVHSVYKRVDSIDQGVYGSVYQGRNVETNEIVALKKVKIKSGHRNGFPITALRETNLLLTLKHPNIVDVKEVVVDKIDNGVFMVMEYMEHDLKRVMQQFMKNPFTVS